MTSSAHRSGRSPSVFISYARKDEEYARSLADALTNFGARAVHLDFQDIAPGERWASQLLRSIDEADAVVVLVSRESPRSAWQEAEFSAALASELAHQNKRVIPVVIGTNTELPALLSDRVFLPIPNPDDQSAWRVAARRITESVARLSVERANNTTLSDALRRERRFAEAQTAALRAESNAYMVRKETRARWLSVLIGLLTALLTGVTLLVPLLLWLHGHG